MRVVDARWEQRNLGVTCAEVTLDARDPAGDVEEELDLLEAQYQVVKVPVGRVDLMQALTQRGFTFVEAAIQVEHDLNLVEPVGLLGRLVQSVEYQEIGSEGQDLVAERIHHGLFDTDRVFLDDHFTAEQAAARYVNWMGDEIRRGASLYELQFREQGVGFFLFREDLDGIGYSVLSGLYDAVRTPGLGTALLYQILAEGERRRLRRLSSSISATNLAVVKTHMALGFKVVAIHYVYVRHGEE